MSMRPFALAIAPIVLASSILPAAAVTVTAPPPGEIQSLQQRAATLETRIAAANEREQIAGEQYDQATVRYQLAEQKLASIKKELRAARVETVTAKRRVRSAAVAAYVYGDSTSAGIATVISKNINISSEVTTYAGVAANNLHAAFVALQRAQGAVQTSLSQQDAETIAAADAVSAANTARNNAVSAANVVSSTLSKVKGQLAAAVAQQAAALAAAAAARAAAAAAAARAQAEQEAEAAAAVAQSVAGSDPSSSAAASAAAAALTSATTASSTGAPTVAPVGTTAAGLAAVQAAESLLGVPYVWGGSSTAGVDCSGMTMLAWGHAGINLLHSAWYQYQETTRVSLNELEPGDLLFYSFPNDGSDPVTHVAMYVGSGPYGTQTVIQAPETGQTVSYVSLYTYGFVGAGRP